MGIFKRVASGLIGFPIVVLLMLFGNQIIIDVVFAIVGLICVHEFYSAFKEKEIHPIKWIGYISVMLIAFMHIIPQEHYLLCIRVAIPITVALSFIQVIITKMKYNVMDVAVTALGVVYIVYFIAFIPMIRNMENGHILIWYPIFSAWGTDTFAYFAGITMGKHKFSTISPKKSIEGCIGGILGSTLMVFVYTYLMNRFYEFNMNYLYIIIMAIIMSVISQFGDLIASSIKRHVDIKDFGNLIPGHGGLLDRFDSMIFVAPFVYLFFCLV